jgi:acetylornithine deacetylase/succinyl-diaminopimelate desuccinylase-like protein
MASSSDFAAQRQQIIDLSIQIQQVAAPTGQEGERARWVANWLRRCGYADVVLDEYENVYACLQGNMRRPALLVSAHTDTVFPAGTDLAVRYDDHQRRIYGPGLGDNSTGVAAMLWLASQVRRQEPPVDVWFVANTGEEGNGNLRGMRAAVDRLQQVLGAAIVIEGMGLPRIVSRALGSRRYRIVVNAPGGHSWSDFGAASAVHVLVNLAAELTRLRPPSNPRTTFNVGVVSGGTSVNTIAQAAELELDLRSEEPGALEALVGQVQAVVQRYQTPRWRQAGVLVNAELIGDRPAGAIADDHPLVQAAVQSLVNAGVQPQTGNRISSTDANVPLSRGIPAVCIGITDGGNAHRLDEWITPDLLPKGMQHLMSLTQWATKWLAASVG